MASVSRPYDLVLLGATGYTGAYTATHICSLFPTDLSWAIAGRNASKLEQTAADIAKRHPDRKAPSTEVVQHESEPLCQLASKTTVLITTIGPYVKYGEVVVKACAEAGTGYIDCTGEVPWVKSMIDKYDKIARETGAIVIPQAGIESTVSDIFAYSLAAAMREKHDLAVKNIDNLLWDMKSDPSGGTLDTAFTIFEKVPVAEVAAAMKPYSLSPVPRPRGTYPARGGIGRYTGVKWVDKLGWAANSGPIMGVTNAAIVWRTWGLFQQAAQNSGGSTDRQTRSASKSEGLAYGPNWHYSELRSVNSRLKGILAHWAITILPLFLILPPLRWLVKKLVFKPGQGPTLESTKNDRIEWRAVAESDSPKGTSQKVLTGRVKWKGSMYDVTGLTLAAGAKVLLQLYKERAGQSQKGEEECYARRQTGGLMTPACLGPAYADGLREGGLVLYVSD